MPVSAVTTTRVREVLNYAPETGIFRWKVSLSPRGPVGSIAGSKGPGGRVVIVIDGNNCYASRLAWLYVNGDWPENMLVHKNKDFSDLRLSNLEEKTASSLRIDSKLSSANKSGVKGVSWSNTRGRWVVMINRNGLQYYLGAFETKEEAKAIYDKAVETGELPIHGSPKKDSRKDIRRQRSATWKDIQDNPKIVGWDDLGQFIRDIGEPPTIEYSLTRVDYNKPLGPGNATWKLPWQKRPLHSMDPMRSYNLGMRHPYADNELFEFLKSEQDGKCGICGLEETSTFRGQLRRLAVDHSHEHGFVRGLLCSQCNNGLGRFFDNVNYLRAAVEFIENGGIKTLDKGRCACCKRPTKSDTLALSHHGESLGPLCETCDESGIFYKRQAELEAAWHEWQGLPPIVRNEDEDITDGTG